MILNREVRWHLNSDCRVVVTGTLVARVRLVAAFPLTGQGRFHAVVEEGLLAMGPPGPGMARESVIVTEEVFRAGVRIEWRDVEVGPFAPPPDFKLGPVPTHR